MSWTTTNLDFLDVEISTSCNAHCIDCNRLTQKSHNEFVVRPWHKFLNKHYPVEHFKKHFDQFGKPDSIVLCGNSGDPMAHPQVDEICSIIRRQCPDSDIEIETNGSLGKPIVFKSLADLGVRVKFSIDGLEDTNHIYRRNVKWSSVIDNAKYYIQQGGKATWDTIDFVHTAHQMDEMKQLADHMGFAKFEITHRFTPDYDDIIPKLAHEKPKDVGDFEITVGKRMHNDYTITPKCMNKSNQNRSLYIESNGTVWPCCTTAQIVYRKKSVDHYVWVDYNQKYGEGWNDLNKRSLADILATGFFVDLEQSWKGNILLDSCKKTCGACK